MQYRFAECILDDQSFTLTRAGDVQPLEPQVFDLIRFLARNVDVLVDKDRLIAEVWDGRIVSDSAVSACISAARRAVGDDGKKQAIIRTVPRRGFQFVAAVSLEGEAPSSPPSPPSATNASRPNVRYATADDGVKIAYTVTGSGPPMVRTSHHPTHLDLDWDEPTERAFIDELARDFTLIRLDQRGCGLSDWDVDDFSTRRSSADILAVVDELGLEKFVLFGTSSGGMVAVDFAAHYPQRLSHLILLGGYVDGRSMRGKTANSADGDVILKMAEAGWETPGSAFISGYLSVYLPTATPEQLQLIGENLQKSCSIENEIQGRNFYNNHSVADLLPLVDAPTLVMHSAEDAIHPLSEGQKLAKGIANAQLKVLESRNHHPLPHDQCWSEVFESLQVFLES